LALLIPAAFVVGSIPFAYLAVRLVLHKDLREHGSGNPGATNAARLWPRRLQFPAFLVIFCLDAGKGYWAAGTFPALLGADPSLAPVLAAAAAVLGHTFTPFLKFKGGKGVATTLGALLALEPIATGAALGVFFLLFFWTRIVAAGSLGMAIALPVAVAVHDTAPRSVLALTILLAILIVVRHRSNIGHMLRREET